MATGTPSRGHVIGAPARNESHRGSSSSSESSLAPSTLGLRSSMPDNTTRPTPSRRPFGTWPCSLLRRLLRQHLARRSRDRARHVLALRDRLQLVVAHVRDELGRENEGGS